MPIHRPTTDHDEEEVVQDQRDDVSDPHSRPDVEPVGIAETGLPYGLIFLRTRPAPSVWVMVPREGGGYIFCRPDRLPDGTVTLDAELAMRKCHVEENTPRRSAVLPSSLEALDDALIRRAGAHQLAAGRESRSSRRVVRSASSRGDPDPEPEPPLARQPRKVGA